MASLEDAIGLAMDEVANRLGTIDGLRASAHEPSSVSPPSAWPEFPDIEYDLTFQGGAHQLMVPVVVVVASNTDRAWRTQLARYLDPIGERSFCRALNGPFGNGYIQVRRARGDTVTVQGARYWGSLVDVMVVSA